MSRMLCSIVLILNLSFVACDTDEDELIDGPPDFSAEIDEATLCANPDETLALRVTFPGRGIPPYTYVWTFDDPNIPDSTEESPSLSFSDKVNVGVTVTVTDSQGRTSTVSDTIRIKDDCTPVTATIVDPFDDVTINVGTSFEFVGAAAGGDGPYTYSWSFFNPATNETLTSSEQNSTQTLDEGTWTVQLMVADSTGDVANDFRTVRVVMGLFSITIPSPENGAIFSVGSEVFFAAETQGGLSPIDFLWMFGTNSGIPNSTEAAPRVTYNTAGDYTVSVTATDSAKKAEVSASISITIADFREADSPIASIADIVRFESGFGGSGTGNPGFLMAGDGVAAFDPEGLAFGPVLFSGVSILGAAISSPASGPEAIVYFDTVNLVYVSYDPSGTGVFGTPASLPGSSGALDIQMVGNDVASESLALAGQAGVQFYTLQGGAFALDTEFPVSRFPSMTGIPGSVAARTSGGAFLMRNSVTPSELWFHSGVENADGTLIGNLGDTPRDLICFDTVCAVVNRRDDTCTIIHWDLADNVTITATIPTGNSPRDVDLMELGNGNIGVAAPGRNGFEVMVAEVTPAGAVVSSTIFDLPEACGSPNAIAWLRDGGTDLLVACLSGQNLVIVPSGL